MEWQREARQLMLLHRLRGRTAQLKEESLSALLSQDQEWIESPSCHLEAAAGGLREEEQNSHPCHPEFMSHPLKNSYHQHSEQIS